LRFTGVRMAMNSKGVTLIELVMVLAVLSIVLGVARMSVTGNSLRELRAACNELQADLRYAQRQAVIEGRKYQVVFDKLQNSYKVLRDDGDLGLTYVVKDRVFDKDIVLVGTTAVNSWVSYTTRGTTGDACTITLRNSEYSADMTVNLGSGRVSQKTIKKL
jgi:prepilin-type N-terminal cleavage/methylation domain-containing protein